MIKNNGLDRVYICPGKCVLSAAAHPTGLRNEPLDYMGQLQRQVVVRKTHFSPSIKLFCIKYFALIASSMAQVPVQSIHRDPQLL